MSGPAKPRPRPCPSCPYRLDAPTGLWAAEEYDKLPGFDGTTGEQAEAGLFGVFRCHTSPDAVCSGWAGCHDMSQSVGVRLGLAAGTLDPAVLDYESPVPLHPSGAAAAEHGKSGLDAPPPETVKLAAKVIRAREGSEHPI